MALFVWNAGKMESLMAVTSDAPDSGVSWFYKIVALCEEPRNYSWKCLLWAHKRVWPRETLDGLIDQASAEDSAPASCFPFQQSILASAGLFSIIGCDAQSLISPEPEPELSCQ